MMVWDRSRPRHCAGGKGGRVDRQGVCVRGGGGCSGGGGLKSHGGGGIPPKRRHTPTAHHYQTHPTPTAGTDIIRQLPHLHLQVLDVGAASPHDLPHPTHPQPTARTTN